MAISILDMVLETLQDHDFQAAAAFPGQKIPKITQTVAAVHVETVDRINLTVTMEVNIVSPASLGGTACELEALRATQVLRQAGAVCVQNRCRYDGVAQVYVVPVLATFPAVTEADSCQVWPGFHVFIGTTQLAFVQSFSEQAAQLQPEYAMGQGLPAGFSAGETGWEFELVEQIPADSQEEAAVTGPFTLKIITAFTTCTYTGCQILSTSRQITQQGIRRIRRGMALTRQEVVNEQS